MNRTTVINRLRQMLMHEIDFVRECEKFHEMYHDDDDIIKYHRKGVKALKKAIAMLEAEK
jgi:hypothetical protein